MDLAKSTSTFQKLTTLPKEVELKLSFHLPKEFGELNFAIVTSATLLAEYNALRAQLLGSIANMSNCNNQ